MNATPEFPRNIGILGGEIRVVSPNLLLMLAIFTLSAALSLGANNTVRYFFGSK